MRLGRAKTRRPVANRLIQYSAPAATSYALTPPSPASGAVGVASGNFTVTPDGVFTGTITPNDSSGGGTFTPASLTFAASSAPQTFTYTPGSAGVKTIAATSSPALTDPSPVTYTASAGATTRTDTFSRADNAGSLGTPSDGGPGYAVYQGVFRTAVYGVSGNAASASAGDTYGAAVLESSSPNADVSVTIGNTLSGFVAVVVRATDANNYLFVYFTTGASAPAFVYARGPDPTTHNDGTTTQLAAATVTFSAGDVIKVRVSGSALTVYQNGTHLAALDVTTTFNQTATQHGFMITTVGDKADDLSIVSLDTSGLSAAFVRSDASSVTVQSVKGAGPFQWYRSATFGFAPGGGNILSGATSQVLVDTSGLSAGTAYEYACVASGSSETARCRGSLGLAPVTAVMVGDSIVQGAGGGVTGDPPPLRTAKMLSKRMAAPRAVKILNAGIIGAKAADWIAGGSYMIATEPVALLAGAQWAVVILGVNDAQAGESAGTFGTDLASCVNRWVALGLKVILPYPSCITDAAHANVMAAYLPQIDALVDGVNVFSGGKELWDYFAAHPEEQIDGIHDLDAGAESRSSVLAGALSRVIDGVPGAGGGGGCSRGRFQRGM